MRIVLDTSVVVAGLRSRQGASYQVLSRVATSELTPLMTTALFLEYEAVLLRPEHRLATGMSEDDVNGFLAAFASAAEPVEQNFMWRPQLTDPSDEMVLSAAINGRAKAIVTHNVKDFFSAAKRFGIPIFTPGALLKVMRS